MSDIGDAVSTARAAALDALLDKQEIYEVLCRYCRGVDRLDLELVRDCYHPDAIDHHVSFDGGRDDFIEWLAVELPKLDGTMHTIGNHLIELNGNQARVETYVNTHSWVDPTSHSPQWTSLTGTRYIDAFERRGHGPWKIKERWAVRSWVQESARAVGPVRDGAPRASRDRSDLVYRDQW